MEGGREEKWEIGREEGKREKGRDGGREEDAGIEKVSEIVIK
jgi:hypothetical protein